ncbi:MAG: DNA-3-methyladenine glycosylase I [Silicimonas sp.]
MRNADAIKGATQSYTSPRDVTHSIWLYEPAKDDALPQMRSKSPASETLSKDLRKLGFKFVGPTTVYAFMQAMGFINDHAEVCWMRKDVETARNTLRTPT